jgi:hypothetical protein
MWHERAAYGHFFYRIPHGESAADAYDRVSGFNESLWREFAEEDFPSVLVLVTHGLMTRIFLMKWYHYSVEYFEDLRNVEHCEFIMMKKQESGKYDLQTELRTWSGYKREQEELRYKCPPVRLNGKIQHDFRTFKTPPWGEKKYGGCVKGCNHEFDGVLPMGTSHEVMQAGRDFGGSRSGATSRAPSSDGSNASDDEDLDVMGPGGTNSAAVTTTASGGGYPEDVIERLKQEAVMSQI